MTDPDAIYRARLVRSVKGMIRFAERRQAVRETKGKAGVAVTITEQQAEALLAKAGYCCALTGLRFWTDTGLHSYGPMSPTFDRIEHAGPYSQANLRVVLSGVNAMRGSGSDADMYRIAGALVLRAPS